MRACSLALLLVSSSALAQTAPPAPPACTDSAHRQFDFWVGDWDVFPTAGGDRVGRSVVEKLYKGCAIRENWMPLSGNDGGSLNNYVTEDRGWRQTWVDSSNGRVEFKGGLVGDRMILSGFWKGVNGPGQDALVRMTYSREAGGAVRQRGESSIDGGKNWSPSFDFTYRPRVERQQ